MASNENTTVTGTGNQVVGKVFILYGTVKALAPDGTVRVLAPNSQIFAHDQIITESDGSISIQFDGPTVTQLDLGRMSNVTIDEDVYAGVAPEVAAESAAEAEQIQQALLSGDDIDLEATAAGGGTGGGGTHETFNLTLTGDEGAVTSGAGTTGPEYTQPGTLQGIFTGGDTTPPAVAITTIEGGNDLINATVADGGITVSGTADVGSTLTVNGVPVTVDGSGSWTTSVTPAGDGPLTITATATDTVGNSSTVTHDLTVDTIAPTVAVAIVDGALTDGDPSTVVTFTFSEAPDASFSNADITLVGGTLSTVTATADPLVYTATFTAADGFSGTGSVTVNADSYTDVALNLGGTGGDTIAIDTLNPTVAVAIVDGALTDGDPSTVVTFTFSEAPGASFSNADITLVGGTLSTVTATADPLVYTATFTAADGFSGTGSVTVNADSYTDVALNLGGTGGDTIAIDTLNPTVAVAIVDGALTDGDPSTVVTFTFSEAPGASFSNADITLVGGTLSTVTATADPLVYTATFTAADGFSGTGSVTVNADSYTDVALNLGGTGGDTIAIDTLNPTVAVAIVDGALTDGDPSTVVTFTFSEAPGASFSNADITLVGGTLSTVTATADPLVYTATFTAADGFSGTGSVTVNADSYTDVALNLGGTGGDTIAIDTLNPTVAVAIVDGALTDGDPSTVVTFTFSEAPGASFSNADITLVGGTLSTVTATADPLVYTATFTAADGFSGTGSVTVNADSYTDVALNLGGTGGDTIAIDTLNPTVAVAIVDGALTDGDPSTVVTFTFSEAPGASFSNADITLVGGTLSTVTATADPLVYTATFTAADGFSGTGSVTVNADSYTDVALNLGGTGGDTIAIDTLNPTVAVAIVDGALTDGDPSTVVTFTFSEAPGASFSNADITLVGGTLSTVTATADPLVYTATFTAADGFSGTGSVTVNADSYTDVALNLGGTGGDTIAIDTLNPTVAVAIVDGALTDGDPSTVVTFTFSEAPGASFSNADITLVGGTLSTVTATADPLVYTATFTAADGFSGTGSVTVNADSYTDVALNLGGTGGDTIAIDTLNPTVAVAIVDGALTDGDPSTVVTFTFSEAPGASFSNADITLVGGTLSTVTATADPLVYTATFTAADGFSGTGSVTVNADSYTDVALNLGGTGGDNVGIDTDSIVGISDLTPQGSGGDVVVYEHDLQASRGAGESAGSALLKESTTVEGTFKISASDGVDDVTVGSHAVITNGVFTATSFETADLHNTLEITGYDHDTGVITYKYSLLDNEDHPTPPDGSGENSLFENLSVTLTDIDGDSTSDTLSIRIVDDVPMASGGSGTSVASSRLIINETTGNLLTGSSFGADGGHVESIAAIGSAKTPNFDNVRTDTAHDYDLRVIGEYGGELKVDSDNGDYIYTAPRLSNPGDKTEIFEFTLIDGDGDTASAHLSMLIDDPNTP